MRGFLVMAMFVASLSSATWNGGGDTGEMVPDVRALEEFDFEVHFAKNTWRIDDVPAMGPVSTMDAPCDSRHAMIDTGEFKLVHVGDDIKHDI